MPIEIRELVIRTVVASDHAVAPGGDHDGVRGGDTATTEEIVQECVRQVLRALKREGER